MERRIRINKTPRAVVTTYIRTLIQNGFCYGHDKDTSESFVQKCVDRWMEFSTQEPDLRLCAWMTANALQLYNYCEWGIDQLEEVNKIFKVVFFETPTCALFVIPQSTLEERLKGQPRTDDQEEPIWMDDDILMNARSRRNTTMREIFRSRPVIFRHLRYNPNTGEAHADPEEY